MSNSKLKGMSQGANPDNEIDPQTGKSVVRGSGMLTKLQRALELGESSFPDLEEQERKEAMQKLVEARMQKRAAEGDRAPASAMPAQEPDEMRRARLLLKSKISSGDEQRLMKEQPRTYEYFRRLKYGGME